MHPLAFYFFLLIAFSLNLFCSTQAYASEDTSCLFCHQYPGLVKKDDNNHLKILHIDTDAYQNSSHGKRGIGCRDCHQDINKIPHLATEKIDCKTGCHETKKDEKLLANQSLKGFHRDQQSFITHLNDHSTCTVCHNVYSHSKQPFIRSWLNMHTGYLACESCHLKKTAYADISYQWAAIKEVEFSGEPFGSYFEPGKKLAQRPSSNLSRIVPGINRSATFHSLINTEDAEKAHSFQATRQSLSSAEAQQKLDYFHRETAIKDQATTCKNCHSKNGALDFIALGFTRERAEVLSNTNIDHIISNYRNFFMPRLF